MINTNAGKEQAARAAAALIESGMVVGLGSGTTASALIRVVGERQRDEGLKILGVPTSVKTAELAHELRIPLRDIDDVAELDIAFDGADEVDPDFCMIKGRGGALLREKIVACAAARRVILVTPEKRVVQLGGSAPVPVEVSSVGPNHVEARLRKLGATTVVRGKPDGTRYLTDGGNTIIDCTFPAIGDPYELDIALQRIVGVFETGLFLGLCDLLVVGHDDRAEMVPCPRRDQRSSCA
jgi:ribose 5-phosphate isomerase A